MANTRDLPTTLWPALRGAEAPRLIERPLVPAYRVGERFRSDRRRWPEGAWYGFGREGHQLTLFATRIDSRLVENVRRGETAFGLTVDGPVLHLAHRFGADGDWGDVPYVWRLQDPDERAVPIAAPFGHRALLWVSLVGADDGLIHAQRGVALRPDFTHALHEAIRAQAFSPFDPLECILAYHELLNELPDADQRLERAAIRAAGNS